jgi:hypothetical protein
LMVVEWRFAFMLLLYLYYLTCLFKMSDEVRVIWMIIYLR